MAEKTTGDLAALPVSFICHGSPSGIHGAASFQKFSLCAKPDFQYRLRLYRGPCNGVLTPIGTALPPTPVQTSPIAAGINSTGAFLYVLNQGSASISVFNIDTARGLLTANGAAVPTAASPQSMVVSPTSGFLYVGNGTLGTISAFAIAANGTLYRGCGFAFQLPAQVRP